MRTAQRAGAERRRRALALQCTRCGATLDTVAIDPLAARLEAWVAGWDHDAWTDGTVIDVCPACVAEDVEADAGVT